MHKFGQGFNEQVMTRTGLARGRLSLSHGHFQEVAREFKRKGFHGATGAFQEGPEAFRAQLRISYFQKSSENALFPKMTNKLDKIRMFDCSLCQL